MSRVDYLADPSAPTANNLVPAASAIVREIREETGIETHVERLLGV